MGISTGEGSRRPWGGPAPPQLRRTLPLGFTESDAEPPAPLCVPLFSSPSSPRRPHPGLASGESWPVQPLQGHPPALYWGGVFPARGGPPRSPTRHSRVTALPREHRQETGPMCRGQEGLGDGWGQPVPSLALACRVPTRAWGVPAGFGGGAPWGAPGGIASPPPPIPSSPPCLTCPDRSLRHGGWVLPRVGGPGAL